ncbi:RND family efflux transporter MFP subunit [Edaphobacter aggregans]|jgi:RND family efflux transporter MFP subunit|uniref:RND family efflux transporter MFP subunit n=1 Tax=Edaphobacter aggregans TaxID=570835 RepID=A0A428MNH2_9BACT|nr:efflux RND transporter periplasmic adaptor subunit [Edaphobacter aggregans]RSL18410.1 RND family efflux transporter MFP subunit [Edaphobacter aggregans]
MSNEALVTHHNTPTLPPSPSHSRSGVRLFLLAPVVLCLVGAVTLFLRAQESKKLAVTTHTLQAEPVSVIHPQSGAPNSDLALPGTIEAYSDSPIYARTSGYVAHWYADIGTHVRQDQLLAVIESPEVDQELSQARASLSQVQANLTLASITAKRYQGLIGTNAVSQQDVDQNNQNLEAQKANLQAANANVSRLQQMQGFERVVAPFNGIITQRRTDIGDLVNAGNGGATFELFRISKIDTVRIFVPVPESYSEQISNGLKATLELTALPGKQFQGSVVRSSHSIDSASHTLLTEIDVPNPSGQLMPGAYAEVHLRASTPIPSLIIPSGAVLYQAAGPQVAIVTNKNEIALKKVALGRDFGNTVEITSGISESDAVVASPPDYLVDGMRVEVQTQNSGAQN